MGFVPPLNLGGFQPSPATLAQWVYQIWQYLQENPIATQEQLQEYIGNFITTSPETQTMIGEGVEQYLTENPPQAPVQSVLGMTGAVQFDSRLIDLNSDDGDTTIYEAFSAIGTMEALVPISSYGVNSGVIDLSDAFSNYDLIVVRCGLDVADGAPGGGSFWIYPVSSLAVNNTYQFLQFDGASSKLYVFSFRFPSETTFKVSACYNITDNASAPGFLNIRRVYGIKLKQ